MEIQKNKFGEDLDLLKSLAILGGDLKLYAIYCIVQMNRFSIGILYESRVMFMMNYKYHKEDSLHLHQHKIVSLKNDCIGIVLEALDFERKYKELLTKNAEFEAARCIPLQPFDIFKTKWYKTHRVNVGRVLNDNDFNSQLVCNRSLQLALTAVAKFLIHKCDDQFFAGAFTVRDDSKLLFGNLDMEGIELDRINDEMQSDEEIQSDEGQNVEEAEDPIEKDKNLEDVISMRDIDGFGHSLSAGILYQLSSKFKKEVPFNKDVTGIFNRFLIVFYPSILIVNPPMKNSMKVNLMY